jgi:FtsP/CotA-like multicopper oxidase with cupredoxin domain
MDRRTFIKYGAATAAAGALSGVLPGIGPDDARAQSTQAISLTISEANVELVDGSVVFMWAFSQTSLSPSVPGPVLRVAAGSSINLTVYNQTRTTHGFSIPGIAGTTIPPIPAGGSSSISFTVPTPGSYIYLDPVDAPVNRVLGLHGAFIVTTTDVTSPGMKPMPYAATQAASTSLVNKLFDSLGGTTGFFPGNPWDRTRDMVWMFNQIDPSFNTAAGNGQSIDPTTMQNTFLPRYFTINGLSGFYSAHDNNTVPRGKVGQPMLIRVMNAGLATHSPHIHGNHIYELSTIDPNSSAVVVNASVQMRDTWQMAPLYRKDVLLPFVRPGDVPDQVWPPSEEPFPLRYPMHCHTELSQTAAGGNYPQGLVTDWELQGPLA